MKNKFLGLMLLALITMSFTVNNNERVNDKLIANEDVELFSCRTDGNALYDHLRSIGHTHREARAVRRQFVRFCRA